MSRPRRREQVRDARVPPTGTCALGVPAEEACRKMPAKHPEISPDAALCTRLMRVIAEGRKQAFGTAGLYQG